MYKEEVVKLMTDYINGMNRKLAEDRLVPTAEIDMIEQRDRAEFDRVNGEIYDLLAEYGIINNVG